MGLAFNNPQRYKIMLKSKFIALDVDKYNDVETPEQILKDHGLIVIYNDEFDREHYPIRKFHIPMLVKLCELLEIKEDSPENHRTFYYFATIHGSIFVNNESWVNCHGGMGYRLDMNANMPFLESVRYIEVMRDGRASLAVTHKSVRQLK